MPEPDRNQEHAIRETAYFIWEREGRPEGRAQDHWLRAAGAGFAGAPGDGRIDDEDMEDEDMDDDEKLLAGRADANIPALLTQDVLGG